MLGIIGGTGLSDLSGWHARRQTTVDTPFGACSAPVSCGELHGRNIAFLPRHGPDHRLAPHKINYRANIWALHALGVQRIVAVAAVGGIAAEAAPTHIVIPHQLIDYTWGREHSFFDGVANELKHCDFTEPYCRDLRCALLQAGARCAVPLVDGGVYGATQGPRLETAAEIARLARDGCTVVGMTGMPEAALARELGIAYVCCAVVVNWAAGVAGDAAIGMAAIRENIASVQGRLQVLIDAFIEG